MHTMHVYIRSYAYMTRKVIGNRETSVSVFEVVKLTGKVCGKICDSHLFCAFILRFAVIWTEHCVYVCMHTCFEVQLKRICLPECIHAYIHTCMQWIMFTWKHTCIRLYIHTYVCIYIYTYVYTCMGSYLEYTKMSHLSVHIALIYREMDPRTSRQIWDAQARGVCCQPAVACEWGLSIDGPFAWTVS